MEHKQKETLQNDMNWEDMFEDLKEDFIPDLIEQVQEEFSQNPTKIQTDTIDSYINNFQKDTNLFLVQAPGGSGKTLSFVIPAILYVLKNYDGKPNHEYKDIKDRRATISTWHYHPRVIILADTKVLVEQISENFLKCLPESFKSKIQITNMYSGQMEFSEFKHFGEVLVCTPQILATLMAAKRDHIYLDNTGLLICDEAELIYETQEQALIKVLEECQKFNKASFIAASATLTQNFNDFATKHFLGPNTSKKPIKQFINLTLEGVTQYSCTIPPAKEELQESSFAYQEIVKLLKYMYIEQTMSTQVMIFLDSIKAIDQLNAEILKDQELSQGTHKIKFDVIHSKMEMITNKNGQKVVDKKKQNQRMKQTYQDFRDNKFQLLLCTDIMARGIDIQKVGLVISIFSPRVNVLEAESKINGAKYMHRIARTGRYNKEGVSLIYFRNNNAKYTQADGKLEEVLNTTVQGLQDNKIENVDIGKDYIKIVVEKANLAVKYNEELQKQGKQE